MVEDSSPRHKTKNDPYDQRCVWSSESNHSFTPRLLLVSSSLFFITLNSILLYLVKRVKGPTMTDATASRTRRNTGTPEVGNKGLVVIAAGGGGKKQASLSVHY
jgi:hypothetical protein